jgi:hypothetical protein
MTLTTAAHASESVPVKLNELSDDEMVSKQREPSPSLVAATGIDFEGLERISAVAIQRWTDRPR